MNDYIRKAVELADGWDYEINEIEPPEETLLVLSTADNILVEDDLATDLNDMPALLLDALAAQLVRQVDVIKKYQYEVFINAADTAIKDGADGKIISQEFGKDRTMNTIKAIVDSKVLK